MQNSGSRTADCWKLSQVGNKLKTSCESDRRAVFDITLVDIRLPDMNGTQLLEDIGKVSPKTTLIVITGFPEIKNAIEVINARALLNDSVRTLSLFVARVRTQTERNSP